MGYSFDQYLLIFNTLHCGNYTTLDDFMLQKGRSPVDRAPSSWLYPTRLYISKHELGNFCQMGWKN